MPILKRKHDVFRFPFSDKYDFSSRKRKFDDYFNFGSGPFDSEEAAPDLIEDNGPNTRRFKQPRYRDNSPERYNPRLERDDYASRAEPSSKSTGDVHTVLYPPDQSAVALLRCKTLKYIEATAIPHTASLRCRLTDAIYLKGLEICLLLENPNDLGPICFKYALVQNKQDCVVDQTEMMEGFFRDNLNSASNPNSKSADFVEYTGADTWEYKHIAWPLNPDKFHIITHGKKKLTNNNIYNKSSIAAHTKLIDMYIPIKRKLVYDNTSTLNPKNQFYFLMWWMPYKNYEYTVGVAKNLEYRIRIKSFYKSLV